MAETTAAIPRPRARWLLVIPPVVLLAVRAGISLAQLSGSWDGTLDAASLVQLALAVLSLIAALALLAGRHIGWLMAMWIVGWDLAVSLVLWWLGEPTYLSMALQSLAAVLITSREMRTAYARTPRP